jgi:MFS family permease
LELNVPNRLQKLRSGPLGSRNFTLLVTCDVISMAGTSIAVVATPFAVLAIGGDATALGYVSAAAWVPMLAFLLAGGVVADRLPRQLLITLANLVQAAAQLLAGVLVLGGTANVAWLVVLTAARGFGLGIYIPAAAGLLPQTVRADQLPQANAVSRVCRATAQIAGAGFGGALVAVIGPGWGLVADAGSYLVAGALRATMRFPGLPKLERDAGIVGDLREGWREFASRRWLWVIVLQISCVTAAYQGAISVLGPLVAHDHFEGARTWGVITAATAVGGLCGGLTLLRFHPRRILLIASLSCLPIGALLFALAVPLPVAVIACAAFIVGVGIEFFVVNQSLAIQQEVPPEILSRVFAYDALGSYALAPIGITIAGPLAASFSAGPVLFGGGFLVVLLTLGTLFVPEIRQLRRRVPDPAVERSR